MANDGEVLGSVAGSQATKIVVEEDIKNPVKTVFDVPMGTGGASEENGVGGQGRDVEVAGEFGFAVALDLPLDQTDAGKASPVMALLQPVDVAGGIMAADFDAPVVGIDGLVEERLGVCEASSALLGEEQIDVLAQRRLVALDGQEVIGASITNGLGDGLLAAHGVDGHQGALEFQHFQQAGDGDDFVFFGVNRFLAENEALLRCPGRDHMQRRSPLALVAATPGCLAVDGDDLGSRKIGTGGPQAFRPGHEIVPEGIVIQRVEQVVQRVMAGNAALERQKTTQKVQMQPAPQRNIREAFGSGHLAAQHQKHDLVQRIQDLPRLPRIGKPRKVLKKSNRLCDLGHGRPLSRGDHT